MCMRSNCPFARESVNARELHVSAFAQIYSILCKYVLQHITAVGTLNHTKV